MVTDDVIAEMEAARGKRVRSAQISRWVVALSALDLVLRRAQEALELAVSCCTLPQGPHTAFLEGTVAEVRAALLAPDTKEAPDER